MVIMSRKFCFKANSILPLENIEERYKARQDVGNGSSRYAITTNPNIKWKRVCQLVIKRKRKESNTIKFGLPSRTSTTIEMKRRSKYIERVLLNHCREKINILSVMFCFLGILLGIFFTLFNTMFPQHHPIGNPKYWYEPMLANLVGWIPIAAVFF